MKKIKDLTPYTNVLPYASEMFGVYQPLLGWRSKRLVERMRLGFRQDRDRLYRAIHRRMRASFQLRVDERRSLRVDGIEPGTLEVISTGNQPNWVTDSIASRLPPIADYHDGVWDDLIQRRTLEETLQNVVVPRCLEWYAANADRQRAAGRADLPVAMVADQLRRESMVAGYLLYLKENGHTSELKDLFYHQDAAIAMFLGALKFQDPLEVIDPFHELDRVTLSPIGVVHLFRQYFFELDTFLGPPVSHVWLSPGGTVELVEISTRRTLTERTTETATETVTKTETSLTEQEELSEAVKESNKADTKFGVTTTANQGWIGGSASASASINMDNTQEQARESVHKQMRQQTEKLSTEIRKNFKSTFKTITEVTDTSSKRYVLSNTTDELLNYELRRKMRQVGVQVQDIGTYLCWQTYVDDPGKQLGISRLVHLAKSPELDNIPNPGGIVMPELITSKKEVSIPFVQKSEDKGDLDEGYKHGWEADRDTLDGASERIKADFPAEAFCPQPGYEFRDLSIDTMGNDVKISVTDKVAGPGKVSFTVHLDYVNFHGHSPIIVVANVNWQPTQENITKVEEAHADKVAEFNELTKHEYEKAFVEAARDRIDKASDVEPRKFEDLREEERIVVYRALLQDMLTKNLTMPDDRTRHVVAELLNSVFDIDKMLYFVSAEWWRPRLHQSHQELGGIAKPATPAKNVFQEMSDIGQAPMLPIVPDNDQIADVNTVSWGGTREHREDNYYITEKSTPAKFGSSLGWLLQLDGDNLRNAFLNAPWVKAVIPIRPGRERAAINWLQQLNVEGTDGLDDNYVAPQQELAEIPHQGDSVTIRDAINHLCDLVATKHKESMKVGKFPTEEVNDDNTVLATPIDKVYEHGFYPLQGGFRATVGDEQFEVFDQWLEILPTDQVVPVEVKYDPKTGRQI